MQGHISTIPLRFDDSGLSPRLFAGQHDTGRKYRFQCLDEAGSPISLIGCTLRMYISIRGDNGLVDAVTESNTDGIAVVTVPNSLLKHNGTGILQFQLIKGQEKILGKLGQIRIEKSIESGATIGEDIWIDWDEIRMTIDEIKNSDAYLKIEEISELVSQLGTTVTEGQETKTALDSTISSANNVKGEIDTDIQKYTNAKNSLDESISTAESTKTSVDSSKASADTAKTQLQGVISAANSINTTLSNTNSTANNTDSKLKTTTTNAETAKVELEQAIADGSAVSAHGHSNKEVLDKLSENQDGLLFDGQPIKGGSGVEDTGWIPVTPMNGCTLSADKLSVRERNGVFYIKGGINIPSTISSGKYIALSSLIVPPLRQSGFWIQDIRSGENIFISIVIITGEGMRFEYGYNISKERMLAIPGTLIY